jgi:hypothetical protein
VHFLDSIIKSCPVHERGLPRLQMQAFFSTVHVGRPELTTNGRERSYVHVLLQALSVKTNEEGARATKGLFREMKLIGLNVLKDNIRKTDFLFSLALVP